MGRFFFWPPDGWLAGKDATGPKVAGRMYEDGDWPRMTVLADARGCWVVDLLLGKA